MYIRLLIFLILIIVLASLSLLLSQASVMALDSHIDHPSHELPNRIASTSSREYYTTTSTISLKFDLDEASPDDVIGTVTHTGGHAPFTVGCFPGTPYVFDTPTILESYSNLQRNRSWSGSFLRAGDEICVCGLAGDQPIYLSLISPTGEVLFTDEDIVFPVLRREGSRGIKSTPRDYCYATRDDRISKFDFYPWEPTGTYTVEVAQGVHHVHYNFEVTEPYYSPVLYYSPYLKGYIAAGFDPFEEVRLFLYKDQQPIGAANLIFDEQGIAILKDQPVETDVYILRRNLDVIKRWGFSDALTLDWDKLIERFPKNPYLYYQRSRYNSSSIADHTRAIELDPTFIDAYRRRAEISQRNGDLYLSILDYTKIIALDPTDDAAYDKWANLYQEVRSFPLAIEELSQVMTLYSEDTAAPPAMYRARAILYSELGEMEKALADYDRYIALNPESPNGYYDRGQFYDLQGQETLALADFEAAIQLIKGYQYFYNNRYAQILTRILELDPDSAWGHYGLGIKESDIDALSRAIELDPEMLPAYEKRVELYMRAGSHAAAAYADYKKIIELKPDSFIDREAAVQLEVTLGLYPEALESYATLARLYPNFSAAYHYRGQIYEELDDDRQAIEEYGKAIDQAPNYAQAAYYARGRLYYKAGLIEQATDGLRKAVTLDAEQSQTKYEQAGEIRDYNLALELNPDLAITYRLRARAVKDREKTIADYTKLIATNAVIPNDYAERARIYESEEEFEQAIADYTQAIQLAMGQQNFETKALVDLLYKRSRLHSRTGNLRLTIVDYEQIVGLVPPDHYYARRLAQLYREEIAFYDQLIGYSHYPAYYQTRGELYYRLEETESALSDFYQVLNTSLERELKQKALRNIAELDPEFPTAMGSVATDFLNVRSAPNQDSSVLDVLQEEESVQLLARNGDGSWLLILQSILPEGMGWVSADYMEVSNATLEALYAME